MVAGAPQEPLVSVAANGSRVDPLLTNPTTVQLAVVPEHETAVPPVNVDPPGGVSCVADHEPLVSWSMNGPVVTPELYPYSPVATQLPGDGHETAKSRALYVSALLGSGSWVI